MNSKSQNPPPDTSRNLEEISLACWLRCDWRALCTIPLAELEKHPYRKHLVLYRVAAHHQLGEEGRTREWIRKAYSWGCDPADLGRMMTVCVLIALNQARLGYLRRSAGTHEPNIGTSSLAGSAKSPKCYNNGAACEVPHVSLLYEAAEIANRRLHEIEIDSAPLKNTDHANQITILKSELGILKQSFTLSQARDTPGINISSDRHAPQSLSGREELWRKEIASHSTSQLGQDLWVLERCSFKRNGYFVEFGATDGVILSNTFLLEKAFGWNGLCAEPNPKSFADLAKNRLCTVSEACIGPVSGEQVEFIFADAYGGMARDAACDKHLDKRDAYRNAGASATLTTVSLHDFLKLHNAPRTIDYISIDTEGSELAILEKFPFDQWDVRMLTVEHNFTDQRHKIRELLEACGYQCQEAQWDDWYFKPDMGNIPPAPKS